MPARGGPLGTRGAPVVLSIGKLGADQAGYYERQVAKGRDDYYSGRGEAPGEWTGRGARALGLEGVVAAAQFNALMAGIDPAGPGAGGAAALEREQEASRSSGLI